MALRFQKTLTISNVISLFLLLVEQDVSSQLVILSCLWSIVMDAHPLKLYIQLNASFHWFPWS